MTRRGTLMTGVLSDNLEKVISPPKWLYFLCGAPASKVYPKGTMRVVEFQAQILGIFLGLYLVWYVISRPTTYVNVVGLGLCVLISYMITAYVSKHYAVRRRISGRKRR